MDVPAGEFPVSGTKKLEQPKLPCGASEVPLHRTIQKGPGKPANTGVCTLLVHDFPWPTLLMGDVTPTNSGTVYCRYPGNQHQRQDALLQLSRCGLG